MFDQNPQYEKVKLSSIFSAKSICSYVLSGIAVGTGTGLISSNISSYDTADCIKLGIILGSWVGLIAGVTRGLQGPKLKL